MRWLLPVRGLAATTFLSHLLILLLTKFSTTDAASSSNIDISPHPPYNPRDYDKDRLFDPSGEIPQVKYATAAITEYDAGDHKVIDGGGGALVSLRMSSSPPALVIASRTMRKNTRRLVMLTDNIITAPLGFIPDAAHLLSTVAFPLANKLQSDYKPNIRSADKEIMKPQCRIVKVLAAKIAEAATFRILGYKTRLAAASIILAGYDTSCSDPTVCITSPNGEYATVCRNSSGFDIGGLAGSGKKVSTLSAKEKLPSIKNATEAALLAVLVDDEDGERLEIAIVTPSGTIIVDKDHIKKLVVRVRKNIKSD